MSLYAPIREHVFKSTTYSSTHNVGTKVGPLQSVQFKDWRHLDMLAATKAVFEGGMSVHQAAELHQVPKSTFGDRISGRVLPGARSGPCTYLTSEEAEELVTFLSCIAQIGHRHTHKEVIAIVERILFSRGNTRTVTPGWWTSFSRRHPNLVFTHTYYTLTS